MSASTEDTREAVFCCKVAFQFLQCIAAGHGLTTRMR